MQNCVNPQKQWHCGDFVNFLANGAVAGKNFKNLDKYWEIWYSVLYGMQEIRWINFNMGCIETAVDKDKFIEAYRLTLTWDVLKLGQSGNRYEK